MMLRKQMPKKRTKKKKSIFNTNNLLVILFMILVALLGAGYYLFNNKILIINPKKEPIIKKIQPQTDFVVEMKRLLELEKENIANKLIKLEKIPKKIEQNITANLKAKKIDINLTKPKIELNTSKTITATKEANKSTKKRKEKKIILIKKEVKKPKLLIIIDDVSFASQTQKIKQIPYKVTPSFMPSSKTHPDTPKLAKEFSVYMVHLPLEAKKHYFSEKMTLKVGMGYKKIKQEIKKIKQDFPQAKFYNNHTGSKFTSHEASMDKLMKVLKEENIIFLDSKTTPHSKGQKVGKKYGMRVLSRDVFLDNVRKPTYIINQLKQAINIAKRRGKAIVICHPYKSTLEVLKNAKPMFKGLNLVYVHEM